MHYCASLNLLQNISRAQNCITYIRCIKDASKCLYEEAGGQYLIQNATTDVIEFEIKVMIASRHAN